MQLLRSTALLGATASLMAIAFAEAPALAQAGAESATADDCSVAATEAERNACLARQAETPEAAVAQSGDAATLPNGGAAEQEGTAIVVTGSRIRRSEFNSPDPITIINPQLGLRQGQIETAELLTSSPLASGSTQITSAISTNYVTNGGADAQTVGLRGLGAERTLILLNGRRAGPAGVSGRISSFDLNVLPSSIVRSIEILKTGASSVYGSDAVAGVVNILTKRDTDGIELRAFSSIPQESGGESYNVSLTYGKDFGRGHFLITGDYFKRSDLKRNDRNFLNCQEEFLTYKDDGSRADIIDPRTGLPACSGVLHNSVLTNNDFTGPGFSQGLFGPNGQQLFVSQYAVGNELNGVCVPLNGRRPGVIAPPNFFGCNFDGPSTGALNQYSPLEQASDVISDVERYTFYIDGSYQLTDGIEAYTELLYNKRKTYTDGIAQLSAFLFTGSSVLPQFFCVPGVDFNCRTTDRGDPFNTEFAGNFLLRPLIAYDADNGTDVDYYRAVLGLRGDLSGWLSGWSYDVYGQYSRSDGDYFQDITLADSIFTQDFRTRSCAGLETPVAGRPCIDIDFLDPRVLRGDLNEQERAFLFNREFSNTVYQQLSGEATVSGDLVTLPAGNLGVALGTQIRQDEIRDVPGENFREGNAYNRSSAGITAGRTLTKEVFGEAQVPLIHNTPLIQSLTLSAAARYTMVDAKRRDGVKDDFSDTTWKLGVDWQVTDWLKLRGTRGTSFRAPALFELFLENQTGFQQQQDIDVCIDTARRLEQGIINQRIFDNCAAAGIPSNFQGATGGATVISGGGIGNLEPETSVAKTLGVVFSPKSWIWEGFRFDVAVDYFDIDIADEITQLGAANIVLGCYNSEFFPEDPLCSQITRATSGPEALNITQVLDAFININDQRNRGIDVTARVSQDLGNLGTVSLLAQMTWQLKDTVTLFEGTEVDLNGEAGEPKFVGDFNLTWTKGPWSFLYGLDVIGGTSDLEDLIDEQGAECRTSIFRPGAPAGQPRRQFCPDVRLSPRFYHAASITREVGEKFALTLGVSNLFNTRPPRASTVFNGGIAFVGQAPVFASQYDYLGRRFFVNVRGNF